MKECYFCGKKTKKYAMVKVAEDVKTIIEVPTCQACAPGLTATLTPEDFITEND